MAFPHALPAVVSVPAAPVPGQAADPADVPSPGETELTAPEILPPQAAPLPLAPADGVGSDLNRELEELIKQKNQQ